MNKVVRDSLWGMGAAGSVLSGQMLSISKLSNNLPFATTTQQLLPGCTGVCGACTGSCLSSIAVAAFLGACAWYNKN